MLETLTRRFVDRRAAGRELAERLSARTIEDPVVLGLARGGVPVAYEVAQALGAPLDVLVVRKIGAPGNPELGIGAIAEGDVRVLNQEVMRHLLISTEELEGAVARARAEVDARVQRYRNGRAPIEVKGRTAIVIDDGLATGGTARAALRAVRAREPRKLVLAVPVGAPESVESLREEADEVICLLEPELMWAVGLWYEHFEQTSDTEIAKLLAGTAGDPPPRLLAGSTEVRIPAGAGLELVGDLVVPESPQGLVVFAHGSGSSRHSPRNRQVARALNERRLATLLLDLLTVDEELDRANVFDIALLAYRLVAATRWAQSDPLVASLPIGYFGASTGAGAALWAAAELGEQIGAVVSRGGRPDLAAERLSEVRAPVLLIVGGDDEVVLELNREAQTLLEAPSKLAIVPRATHLFAEPGALEEVSRLAGEWFERYLARAVDPRT
ncbi:MAG TPA: phosphoribosyltransferase family protein [Solirubrobacteraceae bacterium]|nr:phosphoribosyltransferase family protein [Solirubrobacteraceae bacterium]